MKNLHERIRQITENNCNISAVKLDLNKIISWSEIEEYFISEYSDAIYLDSQKKEVSKTNQYSIIGFNTIETVYTKYNEDCSYISCREDKKKTSEQIDDALEYISDSIKIIKQQFSADLSGSLPFYSGFIGMISYDYQCHLPKNKISLPNVKNRIGLPVLMFRFCLNSIIRDHKDNCIYLTGFNCSALSEKLISGLKDFIQKKKTKNITQKKTKELSAKSTFKSDVTYEQYIADLNEVHNAIFKGDVYQINYTARFSTDYLKSPIDLFKKLKKINPSPFASFFKCDNFHVVSSSPELFIKVQDKTIQTRPIKGTIKKTDDEKLNEKLVNKLKNSKKDRSELLMIVDLERNDFGKICKAGSVKVTSLFEIEEYPTLYHLVSNIEGKLDDFVTVADVLKATFPGGSITGAPKLSAINHIRKLEHSPRELYTGSIGYIDISENMQFNIAIRTVVVSDSKAYISAGGGIVWDSDPDSEYSESLLKARVFKDVLCS